MTKLCVIKTGQTTFEAESRIEPVTGSPLTAEGLQQIQDVAHELASQEIGAVYAERSPNRLIGRQGSGSEGPPGA